jgi:predicted outer membrane protein
MHLSSAGALLVVRASELALQRSRNDSTLRLAGRLKSEHNGIAGQLNLAGRRLNLLPSAAMPPLEQVQYDSLARATDFDVAYLRTMRAAVENCVSRHTAYAAAGGSPTLRPVARFAASVCSEEIKLFRR